jgi:RNA polymerase sigma factor (sigma-70 family)
MNSTRMSTASSEPVAPLVEHFFRHESGRLVSVLTGIFGWQSFDLVEEMVQATLVDALQSWRIRGIPDNPSGWMHRVAKNKVLDALRRQEIAQRVTREWAARRSNQEADIDKLFLDSQIEDSQLRMIFACCHPRLTRENQLALTLKALGGFGISEIARALLVAEEAVKKRLQRATRDLVDHQVSLDPPPAEELGARLNVVHQVLYLIFNEGHSATGGESAIRMDLCEEAARLCFLLCSHAQFCTPATHALMALMLFHAARLDSRLDPQGSVLLMEEQDRSRWDQALIHQAKVFLDRSARGTVITTYHLEAGIALCHCSASSYADTDWPAILRLYDALLTLHRSPIYLLNRAIVVAQIEGPQAGIRELSEMGAAAALNRYHLFDATLGELYRRTGELAKARKHLEAARQKTNSQFDREIIDRQLAKCSEVSVPR